MQLLEININDWRGLTLNVQSYFGDVSIPLRTVVLVGIIAIVLRVIKIKRSR